VSLPSVTEIIREAGLMGHQAGDYYLDRGSALHLACRYYDEGTLDEATVDPVISAKLEQWRRFRAETDWVAEKIEWEVESQLGYVGHPDRGGWLNRQWTILDIKPSDEPWHGIQLAAYVLAMKDERYGIARYNVVLTDTGYRLIPRRDRADRETFLAALRLYQWRARHWLIATKEETYERA
jgi:hypothetical protein